MSKWLNDGEVLVGQGSGEVEPVSPRMRGLSAGSPRTGQSVYSPLASPRDSVPGSPRLRGLSAGSPRHGQSVYSPLASPREAVPGSPQAETMGKAKELFVLCDKEGKGFITKRDMQVSS